MKQEASFFENREAILIYIAKKLRDATRLESVLTEPETVAAARVTMERAGFKPYLEFLAGPARLD